MAADPYRYFRVEARELLDQLGKGALDLDKGAAGREAIAKLLRLAHTLKGAARVVKAKDIAERAHAIEDHLAGFRDSGGAVPRDRIDAVLADLDSIAVLLAALASEPVAGTAGAPADERSVPPVRTDVDDMDALLDGLAETSVKFAALRTGIASLERGRRLTQLLEDHLSSPQMVKLNGSALKLRSLAAELRVLVEGLERNLGGSAEQMARELRQVRETAERLRLVPASFMFVALERVARDAAQSLGKRVQFAARGGDVRLDAHVFGAVRTALVQAVRNAVAHGIETAAQRQAAGKPAEGRISVEVSRRGNHVAFVCRDDGPGVDLEAVRRALERQGRTGTDIRALGAQALMEALLKGGISTSGAVTGFAGRGVGLDVIREAVQRIGGEVGVHSQAGAGLSLEIVVPVSIASVDALMVEAGEQILGIPLGSVKQTVRVTPADLARSGDGASIVVDGRMVPFAPLARLLRGNSRPVSSSLSWSAIVVQGSDAMAALGVDHLRGTENLVVRPRPGLMRADEVVAGASLDSQGHAQLILDPEGLVRSLRHGAVTPPEAPLSSLPILIVDDSLTTRMLEQSILESAGYEVDLAASGEEALERARSRRYSLFLVDVEMPGMDGFTFIERTRRDPELRSVPAVLVTSRARPEDRKRGEEVGARAYIVKSEFDQLELLGRIRALVGGQ